MSQMIPAHTIGGKQFLKARDLHAPVVIIDKLTYQVASEREGGPGHTVCFDSAEFPLLVSCTCEAFKLGNGPCWAMARALDALTVLSVNIIFVRGDAPRNDEGALAAPVLAPAPVVKIDSEGTVDFIFAAPRRDEEAVMLAG